MGPTCFLLNTLVDSFPLFLPVQTHRNRTVRLQPSSLIYETVQFISRSIKPSSLSSTNPRIECEAPACNQFLPVIPCCVSQEHGFHLKVINSLRRHYDFWYQVPRLRTTPLAKSHGIPKMHTPSVPSLGRLDLTSVFR